MSNEQGQEKKEEENNKEEGSGQQAAEEVDRYHSLPHIFQQLHLPDSPASLQSFTLLLRYHASQLPKPCAKLSPQPNFNFKIVQPI